MHLKQPTHVLGALAAAVVAVVAFAAPALAAPKPPNTNVSVTRSGVQLATVTDSDGQIACGADCSGSYEAICVDEDIHGACLWERGATVLHTDPPSGFRVLWSYDCEEGTNDTNNCTVSQSATVDAHFDDTSAPNLNLTGPANGTAASSTINLSASASDPQSGIANVQFLVDGVAAGTADTSAPYGVSYDTTSHPDDSDVTVTARATNTDGDQTTSTVHIKIDNTAPQLTMSGADGQTFGPGTTQTWTYSASDAITGPPVVQCSVVPAGEAPSFGACSGSGSHSVTNKPDGDYVAAIKATDGAGHVTQQSRTFSIDAVPPQTSITGGPVDGSSSTATSATFTFTSSEAGSTFECRVYPAALTPGAFGACTENGTHSASGFSPGTYAFEVRATDPYGNVDASPAKRTFTVTAPPPTGGNTGGTGGTTGGSTGGGLPVDGGTNSGGTLGGGRIDAKVRTFWLRFGKRTRVGTLTVTNAPVGATVTLKCKGKGCAFKKRTLKLTGTKLALAKRFKKRKLAPGTVISIVIAKDGWVGKSFRYTTRAGKFPKLTLS